MQLCSKKTKIFLAAFYKVCLLNKSKVDIKESGLEALK